jgi:4-hydroxybutyrate CoA-transferase
MNWMDEYRSKLTSAEDAVRRVHSGHRVFLQGSIATPEVLIKALLGRADELRDVEVVQGMSLGMTFCKPEHIGHFITNTHFVHVETRKAFAEGRADYFPCRFSDIERVLATVLPVDVAFIHTSPPDADGNMSLGTTPEFAFGAAKAARCIVVQTNKRMPQTLGRCNLHVSEVAAVVEVDEPLVPLSMEPVQDFHRKIAGFIEPLIPNGATLEVGVGGIPNSVLACCRDKKDIGIHTEAFTEGIIDLIEAGVITNRRKSIHQGKIVCCLVLGGQRAFDYVDKNPLFEFHPISHVCDPYVIAQNDRMVAINNAMQVDLTGQICSDSIGHRPYSGFGGQLDFNRGASLSKGGVPILTLESTAKKGEQSRIVPCLDPGAGVVVNRAEVHYVITEYGAVNLWGRNLRQRAEGLISISHPKFRDELYDQAVKFGYLEPKKQKTKRMEASSIC